MHIIKSEQQPLRVLSPPVSQHFSGADAKQLVSDGIARPVSKQDLARRPTRGVLKAFTVLEPGRRRAIHWPEVHNAALRGVYRAHLPQLQHSSNYLDIAREECGAVLDLKAGFYQIGIDESMRDLFRFRDNDGQLYEMTRLIMGGSPAVEIMQLVTSVVVGDPYVVRPQYASPAKVHTYVDGACLYGDAQRVSDALLLAEQNAKYMGATFKDFCLEPRKQFDFVGISFDLRHRDCAKHTVRVADNVITKLGSADAARLSSMTGREVEQLVGRLLFCAGVTQCPLVNHYFSMKWAKRVCNAMNTGRLEPHATVTVPPSVVPDLQRWITEARTEHVPRFVDISSDSEMPVLFFDATLSNYGGVLVLPTNKILITGATFDDGKNEIIAVREAQAGLFCLQDFREALAPYRCVDMRSDNTTVEYSLRRGCARTDTLAKVVCDILKLSVGLDIAIIISRVASVDNPADEPSRQLELSMSKLQQQLAIRVPLHQRRGAGRTFCVCL